MSSTLSRSNKGMTLIELLVTISIITVVTGALMGIIQSFYKDNDYLIEETASLANARSGIDKTVYNIRQATYGDDGSYPITTAGTSTLTIYADADHGSDVEKLQYSLVNGTLYQYMTYATGSPPTYTGTQSTTTVATYVQNSADPIFTYYDKAGNQLSSTSTNIASISSVRVNLEIDLNPNRAPNLFTLSEVATLRNLQQH